ncbi:MAG: 50S ribosomal protein L5 [Candidatus Nealsonbacteria bacterium]|nr:50S ribosomal protein L5 [Candidatus Nealsonbacteria bacterium]
MTPLLEKYKKEAIPAMMKKFGYKTPMAVPKVTKVVVNSGFGRLVTGRTNDEQRKTADLIVEDISLLCGQHAVKTTAKKAIASFKTREGMVIGAMTTLRGKKMIGFLEKFIHVVLPRTRDFKGIDPKAVDNSGNLTIAIKEHIAFPEILPEKARNIFGLEVTIVTSAKKREEGLELLRLLGFPLKI